jgi:hypothetical protein
MNGDGKDNASGAAVDDHGFVDPLADGIDRGLVEERDGAEHFDSLDAAVDIGSGFDDDNAFHAGLACDFRVEGFDAFDEFGCFDFADGSDWGFDFADDTAEDTADDTAEDAADDAAFDSAFDSAFDADIDEFFFGDFVRDFDRGDELSGFDVGLGLDGFDAGAGALGWAFFGWGRRRWRRRWGRSEKGAVDFDLGKIAGVHQRKNDHSSGNAGMDQKRYWKSKDLSATSFVSFNEW